MDVGTIIDELGGNKAVMGMTGLTKGRISQWRTENHIPRAWRKFFAGRRPDLFPEDRSPPVTVEEGEES